MNPLARFAAGPWRAGLLVGALALALYVPGCRWGVPHATAVDRVHAWGNDDLVPLAPLAEMYNTFVRAEPNRNVAYPWAAYAVPAAAFAPYLGWLAATGGLRHPTGAYPFGLADPPGAFRVLTLIGRVLSLLLAVAAVVATWAGARAVAGDVAGVSAALAAMVLFPVAYYARTGNPDIAVHAWTSLALAAYMMCLAGGATVRRAFWFGVFLAMAGATKDQAAGSFVLLVPVLAWMHWRHGSSDRLGRWAGRWTAPLAAAVGFVPVYLVASGIPFDLARYRQHLAKIIGVGAEGVLYLRYPATGRGYLLHLADMGALLTQVAGWPLLALAAVGAAVSLREDRRRLVLLLSSLGFVLILMPVRFSRIHYLLPVALPLTYLAGAAVAWLWRRSRRYALAALAAALVLPTLWTVDLTHDMIHDSRYEAGRFLAGQARPGDTLVSFGAPLKLPRLAADISTVSVDYRAEAQPTLERVRPALVVIGPEDTNEDRQRVEWRVGRHSVWNDYVPDSVMRGLADGRLGYRLVARLQTPRLFPWLSRPFLSYGTVNPPVLIFLREDRAGDLPRLALWETAPHNPPVTRTDRLTVDYIAAHGDVTR